MFRTKEPPTSPETVNPATAAGKLAAALQGGRTYVDVDVPGTSPPVRGKLRRLTRSEEEQVSLELGEWLAGVASRGDVPPGRLELNSQEATRTIARAVREFRPDLIDARQDPPQLAALAEWSAADDDQIGAIWTRYQDLVDRSNPFTRELSPAEWAEVNDAVAKKDAARLHGFAHVMLTGYLLSSASLPATSTTTG